MAAYEVVWVLLRGEGWLVNRKRIRWLYRLDGLHLRMRVRRRKHPHFHEVKSTASGHT